MVRAIILAKDNKGNYSKEVENGNYNNEKEVELRAMSLNCAYMVIAEY